MKRSALVFLGIGLLALGGCGSDSNTTPDAAGGAGGAGTGGMDGAAGAGGTPGTDASGAAGSDGAVTQPDAAAADGGADATAGGGDGGGMASMSVTSAGGTVTAGPATLVIPAGALAAATTITVSASAPADALPERASIVGQVYELGPNGTMFAKPVWLTLPFTPTPTAPAGTGPVISWLDTASNTWMDLPTTASGGTVTAQATHFTRFAVRLVAGARSCAFGGACAGSLAGTWDVTDLCIGKAAKDVNDICGKEDTSSYVMGTGGTGTLTVAGDNKYMLAMKANITAVYSPACLTRTMIASCPAVQEALVKFLMVMPTCTGTAATGCECTFVLNVNETGTVTSNQLVRDSMAADETQVGEACAQGSDIQIRSTKTKTTAGKPPVVTVSVLTGKKK